MGREHHDYYLDYGLVVRHGHALQSRGDEADYDA